MAASTKKSKMDPRVLNQFYKSSFCKFYLRGAEYCKRGDQCSFAHSQEELKSPPNLNKTKLCKDFMAGRCKHSCPDDCFFAHGLEDMRATEGLYKTEICYYYEKGQCVYGSQCRYAHGMEDMRGRNEGLLQPDQSPDFSDFFSDPHQGGHQQLEPPRSPSGFPSFFEDPTQIHDPGSGLLPPIAAVNLSAGLASVLQPPSFVDDQDPYNLTSHYRGYPSPPEGVLRLPYQDVGMGGYYFCEVEAQTPEPTTMPYQVTGVSGQSSLPPPYETKASQPKKRKRHRNRSPGFGDGEDRKRRKRRRSRLDETSVVSNENTSDIVTQGNKSVPAPSYLVY